MAFDLDDEELEATRRLNGVGSISEEDILNEIDFCLAGEYITIEHRQAIEGLLKMYQQEKEKNNELIKIIKNVRQMHDTKCKIIDMMAKEIANYDPNVTIDLIKEYYFKKVTGE